MTKHKKRSQRSLRDENGHKPDWIFLIVIVFLGFVATATFGALAHGDSDGNPVLFSSTLDDIDVIFAIDMTAQEWFQYVVAVVFIFQFIWLFYAMTLICKRPGDGKGYLYFRPPFIPKSLYAVFLISLLLLIAFLFFWTEERVEFSFFFMLGVAVFAMAAFVIAVFALRILGCDLIRLGSSNEIGLDRGFVLNGLGLYAAVTTFWATFTFAVALTFEWNVSDEDASTIGLSVYGGLIVLYFLLDLAAFRVALMYIIAPYIGFVLVLAAVFTKDWDSFGERNSLLSLVLLAFASFALIFKVAFTISQACNNPEPLDDICEKKRTKKKKRTKTAAADEPESEATETTEDEETDEEDEEDDEEDEKDDFTARAKILLSR